MATDGISAALAVRSSVGLELWSSSGLKVPYSQHPQFAPSVSKFCSAAVYSPDGRYLAWVNGQVVNICTTTDWRTVRSLPRPKACYLKFSPAGNYLMTYESFFTTKESPQGSHNLYVYDANTGDQVYSIVQKNQRAWEPVWSQDESIMALMLGGEAFFFDAAGPNGLSKHSKKIGSSRNGTLSMAPNAQQPFVAFCVPGTKGGPSQCKIYKYPDLQAAQPVAFKSFFQADSVEMLWNRRGNGLLLLTSTDVDQTGASYYGKQALHFMSTRGESYSVQLSKEGSVHAVSWNPNSTEFCVVYGFMPAKSTFYNLKCDATFEAGEGDKNSIYYNDFGTLVILAGFGNLSGKVEIWDVQKKKLISNIRAPDTTALEWCPNGELFVTATTAPRLRVGNCFKVWHYSGALLHETLWPVGQELYEVSWQRFAAGAFTVQPISAAKIDGIKSSQPLASAEPYRPPGARGIIIPPLTPKTAAAATSRGSGGGGGGEAAAAAAATNRKDRRTERNKTRATTYRKKFENGAAAADPSSVSAPELTSSPNSINNNTNTTNNSSGAGATVAVPTVATTTTVVDGDAAGATTNGTNSSTSLKATLSPEELSILKRQRTLRKKLVDIAKLKWRKDNGEYLEINQLAKITSEADVQKELADLKL